VALFGWFRRRPVDHPPDRPAQRVRRPYLRRATRARFDGIMLDAFTRGGPLFEHPTGEHATAVEAITAVLEQKGVWIRTSGRVTLTAQGPGPVVDTYRFASVVLDADGVDLKCHGVDAEGLLATAGLAADGFTATLDGTRLTAPKGMPARLARFLDAYFRQERGIAAFPGEGDYALGVEPGASFLDDTEPGLAPVDIATASVIPGTDQPPADAPKKFHRTGPLRRLVDDPRACIASDRILVDGRRVGYMVREAPSLPEESGWEFFSDDETEAYLDTAANFGVYGLNSVANVDPEIVPFLWAPPGAIFQRIDGGPLRRASGAAPRG
jgi:hypothetical protein